MAISVLDKYGIKEVADITFYQADKNGKPAYPVLYIDTAKVSTIEQTAEETTANGGKGNPPLISWDYNKDINVTLEDALFSAKSLAIMFGNGEVSPVDGESIMKTEVFTVTGNAGGNVAVSTIFAGQNGWDPYYTGPDGKRYAKLNPKFYDAAGKSVATCDVGEKYFCSYDLKIGTGSVIRVGADTFPGTYYVIGETYARSEANGEDEFFQFVLPKAKVLSENTITLEAEGDPSVFNMNLHVLRPASGDMMLLIKYDLADPQPPATETFELIHNHALNKPMTSGTDDSKDPARAQGMNGTTYIENDPDGNKVYKTIDAITLDGTSGTAGVAPTIAGVAVTLSNNATFAKNPASAKFKFEGGKVKTDTGVTNNDTAAITITDGLYVYQGTVTYTTE